MTDADNREARRAVTVTTPKLVSRVTKIETRRTATKEDAIRDAIEVLCEWLVAWEIEEPLEDDKARP